MRMRARVLVLASLSLVGLLLLAAACSPTTSDQDMLRTVVAATIYAELTAQVQPVIATTPPTATPAPTAEDMSTPDLTSGPAPGSTAPPTTTPEPTGGLTPSPCLPDAVFVTDVTVPDGTTFAPSEEFTKTWQMRSDGCAPWPADSSWVFDSGDQMGAPKSVPVPDTPLGSTADISVDMVAPDEPGTYQGFWQMQNPRGVRFGNRVFVMIVVPGPTPTPEAGLLSPALAAWFYSGVQLPPTRNCSRDPARYVPLF